MDNRYFEYNCPPLMSDGRFITNYVKSNVLDQNIKNINNIKTSHQYRQFLQDNGSHILNNIKAHIREANTCKVEGKCVSIKKRQTTENNEETCKFCN